MATDSAAGPIAEHPFTRARRTWEAWSSADTWTRVVAEACRHHRDLSALGDLDELTNGPDPLEALQANREVVETMTGWQWHAMRAAREQGYGWHEVGQRWAWTLSKPEGSTWQPSPVKSLLHLPCRIWDTSCAMTPTGGIWPATTTPAVSAEAFATLQPPAPQLPHPPGAGQRAV
jgi:hypothetical protein